MSATASSSSVVSGPIPEEAPAAKHGRAITKLLSLRKFEDVVKEFDATMASALPKEKLEQTWDGIAKGVGAFDSIVDATVIESGAYRTAVVTTKFGSTNLDLKIAFDKDDKIAGFFVSPTPQPWSPPSYADASRIDERDVLVNPGPWQVPGTLTLPKGDGPFPALILVHGSGPNDRDETVGPNKPFKDIALGLAARNIAVLRYEKRTKEHGPKIDMKSFGIDDESVEDALAAIDLLSKRKDIDPAKIYVAGHSLGGTFAPRIGEKAKNLAGLVILAGATRGVPEMMIEQMTYIASLDGRTSDEENKQLEGVKKAQKRIAELQTGAAPKDGEVVLGAGAKYWVDLGKYKPTNVARDLSMPIFVAQGGRDYQVTEVDFRAWEAAIGKKPNVQLKHYPTLNHLFIAGTGKSTPEEYQQAGHVDELLIDDLARWITAH